MKRTLFGFALMVLSVGLAAEENFYTGRLSSSAIEGYDVVSYFTEGRPIKGREDFSYDYQGVKWLFSSTENRDLFISSPDQYLPQYGGYCAYGMSMYGRKVKIDPHQWTIKDDKLYLNFNRGISDRFKADIRNHITQADENWRKLK